MRKAITLLFILLNISSHSMDCSKSHFNIISTKDLYSQSLKIINAIDDAIPLSKFGIFPKRKRQLISIHINTTDKTILNKQAKMIETIFAARPKKTFINIKISNASTRFDNIFDTLKERFPRIVSENRLDPMLNKQQALINVIADIASKEHSRDRSVLLFFENFTPIGEHDQLMTMVRSLFNNTDDSLDYLNIIINSNVEISKWGGTKGIHLDIGKQFSLTNENSFDL